MRPDHTGVHNPNLNVSDEARDWHSELQRAQERLEHSGTSTTGGGGGYYG